jgi:hypothetical protein
MTIRKSNRGISVDFDTLIKQADKSTTAVGNMRVNAHGDVIGANGQIIKPNEERVREYYTNNPKSSTSNVSLKGKQEKKPLEDPEPTKKSPKKEPLGYKEVEQPNGDIKMVPYYDEKDA